MTESNLNKAIVYFRVCLASQSPRRRELLKQIGVDFEVRPANIDEQRWNNEKPYDYVRRITLTKASTVWQQPGFPQDMPVLASDTAVVVDDDVLGKPENEQESVAMLSRLSGRTHQVLTGVGIMFANKREFVSVESEVTFREISEAEMRHYWKTGEGRDKAGGYAVQGLAASFVANISGSFSGVMGLPLFETSALLQQWRVAMWLSRPHS